MSYPPGRTCPGCKSSEARCAWLNGKCCGRCGHWQHLDARGNDRDHRIAPPVRVHAGAVCMTCRRPIPASGRASCLGQCLEVRRAFDRARRRSA